MGVVSRNKVRIVGTDSMGGLYCCIVACSHIENDTDRRTSTMAAPLLLTSGPVRSEDVLYDNFVVLLCVCMHGIVWIEPDKCESILHVEGQSHYVEGGVNHGVSGSKPSFWYSSN